MNNKTIALGSDHAGFELKNDLIVYLIEKGYDLADMGLFRLVCFPRGHLHTVL